MAPANSSKHSRTKIKLLDRKMKDMVRISGAGNGKTDSIRAGIAFAIGIRIVLVGLVLAGLTACGDKFSQYGNDAPRTAVVNADPADIISFPDGFGNMSTKCDHGNRVYSLFHSNSNYGAIAIVPNDPSCAK